jgi:hypothetical protein
MDVKVSPIAGIPVVGDSERANDKKLNFVRV